MMNGKCLGHIEAGHSHALSELLFLYTLLHKHFPEIELPQGQFVAGFSDVFRTPEMGEDFIRVSRIPDGLVERIEELRKLVLEGIKRIEERSF
jgi:hypothetical protein